MKTILKLFCLIAFLANLAQAQKSEEKIKNLDTAKQVAENALQAPILFPLFIPDNRELYAYPEVIESVGLIIISLSLDAACQGAKYCSRGGLHIKKGGNLEARKDMSGQPITEIVRLQNNIKGYYTPGHAMGDYWPPSLQWVYKDVLYDLWWNEGDLKTLIEMANSALSNDSPD